MRKVIDLCLDLPMDPETVTQTLRTMCLDPGYSGYKHTYAPQIARDIGLDIHRLDAIAADQGEAAFVEAVRSAALAHEVTVDDFVGEMDRLGIQWGCIVSDDHDNEKTGRVVASHPDRFKGFAFVDPNRGMAAVRELERAVKEYGLHALYLTAFRTKLPANDKKNYPLYAKCCELGIPVHIYCSLNLSASVPYDIGHPRYIDEVARDFPELKIMAGVSGWPWVLDFFALPLRHKNVYINFETHEPQKFDQRGSGYESYLYYAEHSLMDRICFATNWTTQSLSLETLISQVEALPLSDKAKEHIFYLNAKRFYEEL